MKSSLVAWLLAAVGVAGLGAVALLLVPGHKTVLQVPIPTSEPALQAPSLPQGLWSLGEGNLDLEVLPDSKQAIDALGLARQATTDVPTCAQLIFLFSYRVTDGQIINFTGNRMGGEWNVAQGNAGEARMTGCALLEAVNHGAATVHGQLHFVIATSAP